MSLTSHREPSGCWTAQGVNMFEFEHCNLKAIREELDR